jgi:hypothetical protein
LAQRVCQLLRDGPGDTEGNACATTVERLDALEDTLFRTYAQPGQLTQLAGAGRTLHIGHAQCAQLLLENRIKNQRGEDAAVSIMKVMIGKKPAA